MSHDVELALDWAAHAPRPGDMVTIGGKPYGTVERVEVCMCYISTGAELGLLNDGHAAFIWVTDAGLNQELDWPGKVNPL